MSRNRKGTNEKYVQIYKHNMAGDEKRSGEKEGQGLGEGASLHSACSTRATIQALLDLTKLTSTGGPSH